MPSTTHTVCLLVAAVVLNFFSGIHASKIYSLDVPLVVRNGTGPIDLFCIYNIKEYENGLVIKWFHNMNQIYQWIPPIPPQYGGVINGFTKYPEQNLKYSNSRSIIRLKMVTVEMSGEYTCTISTFQEEDSATTKMIVHVPETDARIYVSSFNNSHLNLSCVVNNAHPRPTLKFYAEGIEVDSYYDEVVRMDNNSFSVSRSAILKNTLEPVLLECEITIPETDYKSRERIVYYPIQPLFQISSASRSQARFLKNKTLFILFYILMLSSK